MEVNQPQLESKPKRRSILLPLLLAGFFLTLVAIFVGMAVMVFSFRGEPAARVTDNSILEISLGGYLNEYRAPDAFEQLADIYQLHLHDYANMIRKAGEDPRIEGILLEITPVAVGWGPIEELRDAIHDYRKSGKWIVAHGEMWQEREYILAAACDEAILAPEGIFALDGFMIRASFYGDLLRKYGIGVQVASAGEYKSMGETFERNGMSDYNREATLALLTGIEANFLDAVSQDRGLERSAVEAVMEQTTYHGGDGLENGLLDQLLYRDQLDDHLAAKVGVGKEDLKFVPMTSYAVRTRNAYGSGPAIAVIHCSGNINSGSGGKGAFGDSVIGSGQVTEMLKKIRSNSKIKAVVLRIDSGGGSALASDIMWREIRLTAESGIPVYASMGSVAASGGYYMAMACDKIYAQPTTITGSIGVVGMRLNFERLYKDFLVNVEILKTAPSADFFDPARMLTEAEQNRFQKRTSEIYDVFITKAAESRKLSFEDMDAVARGRVWIGSDALNNGLVDEMGGLNEAVIGAAEKAGLSKYQIIRYPLAEDPWTQLRESAVRAQVTDLSTFKALLPDALRGLADMSPQRHGHGDTWLAVVPFQINID